MLEFGGSLKASQLQVGLLETFREAGNLVLFHPQPFHDSAKHLQPRGSDWQVKWPQQPRDSGRPSTFLSGQASCRRMRTHTYHCSWVAFVTAMLSVYQYSHFGGIADPTKRPHILSAKTASPPPCPGTIFMRFTTQL